MLIRGTFNPLAQLKWPTKTVFVLTKYVTEQCICTYKICQLGNPQYRRQNLFSDRQYILIKIKWKKTQIRVNNFY